MDGFTQQWNLYLVWPIQWALLSLTGLTGNAGIAIVLFTVLVRTAVIPLALQQIRSQKRMMALQPKLRELQRRHSGDRSRIAQEQMALYKAEGVNPLAGCLPMLIQMPIWIALYSALQSLSSYATPIDGFLEFKASQFWTEAFDPYVEAFQHGFLWIPSLAHPDPIFIMPVLTAATQWVVQKMSMMPTADPQQQQMNKMMEFMPIMFFVFSLQVPAGLTVYWVVSNLYSFVQQYFTVGWGSLPFLGSGGAPRPTNGATDARPGQADPGSRSRRRPRGTPPPTNGSEGAPESGSRPRRRAGPSSRKRRGK